MSSIQHALSSVKVDVSYLVKKNETNTPYIVYYEDDTISFYGDDSNVAESKTYTVELYSSIKNQELELKIEKVLKDNGYTFKKNGDIYIDNLVLTAYYVN